MARLSKAQRKRRDMADLETELIRHMIESLKVMDPCTKAVDLRYLVEACCRLRGLLPPPTPDASNTPALKPSSPDLSGALEALQALSNPPSTADPAQADGQTGTP